MSNNENSFQLAKIIQVDNSLGIIFTEEMLHHLKVTNGEHVQVEMKDSELVIKKISKTTLPPGISDDFYEVLHDTVEHYDAALNELKD